MANRFYPKRIGFSTAIPFDQPGSVMPKTNVTGALTFTINATDAQPLYGTSLKLVADGSHAPDFSAFALEGPGNWVNTAGTVNKCFFYYDDDQYCVIISQPGAGGTGGGGLTQLSTPGSFTATPISSSEIDLSWSDVANDVGYKIYFNGVNDFGSASLLTTTATNATSYNHTGLSSVSTFYYWIKAVGDGTTYSDSNTASANATTMSGGGGSFATANRLDLWKESGIAQTSGLVDSWTGEDGSGIVFTPAVGEEPAYDSTDDAIVSTGAESMHFYDVFDLATSFTVYALIKLTGYPSELLSPGSGYVLYMDGSSMLIRPDNGGGYQSNASHISTMSTYKVLTVVVTGGSTASVVYLDGVAVGSFDTATLGSGRAINRLFGEDGYKFKGKIKRMAIFNVAHDAGTVATNSPLLTSA